MTKWTSEACRDLREDKELFTKLLEKTGLLMTVDGSGLWTMSFNTELCVACNIGSMFSVLNLQLSFVFLHFLDPMFRTYTLIVGFTA